MNSLFSQLDFVGNYYLTRFIFYHAISLYSPSPPISNYRYRQKVIAEFIRGLMNCIISKRFTFIPKKELGAKIEENE